MFSWLQVLMKHKIKKLIRLIKYFLFYSVDYVAVFVEFKCEILSAKHTVDGLVLGRRAFL